MKFQFQYLSTTDAPPGSEIIGTYDPILVFLSIVIATIAAYTALTVADYLSEYKPDTDELPRRVNWVLMGAIAMGCGIWCMHFIGMLAFKLPIPVHYDPWITIVSMAPAILASGVALHVISQPHITFSRAHVCGLLMGTGIGTMHYIGMAAMVMNAEMVYDAFTFVLSIVVAYVLATAAVYAKFILQISDRITPLARQSGASLFMGCAVAGMHYTGMAAAHYYPVEATGMPAGIDTTILAAAVISGTLLVLGVTIGTVYLYRRLHQAALTIENLVESAPDALVTMDPDGLISVVNRQTEITFGYDRKELIGKPIEILVPHEQRQMHVRHRANYLENPAVRSMGLGLDLYVRRKDGTEFPVEIRLSYERTRSGIFVTSLIRDISLRKKAENEKHLLEQQLLQSQKMEAVGRLAGGVAHDFNNILTGIGGYVELLRETVSGSKETTDDFDELQNLVNRGTTLTRQLLTFSRKDMQSELEVVDLNDVLHNMNKMIQTLIGNHHEYHLDTDADLGLIKASTGKIEQIVMNLVINASDAIADQGTITVTTYNAVLTEQDAAPLRLSAGEYSALSIQDTGNGMSTEVQQQIFEPFFTTKKVGEGTGLGLAIVFGVVEQYKAGISVDSTPGAGTTFTIYFPQTRVRQTDAKTQDATEVAGGHETILLIEDDTSVRTFVYRTLSAQGYTVFSAADGQEGLNCLIDRHGNVDLVLTDLVMPKMGGRQLAKESLSLYPDLKILFMSGYDRDRNEFLANIPLIDKPFHTRDLLQKVRLLLDS